MTAVNFGFPQGPWTTECNQYSWEAHGLHCHITRAHRGFLSRAGLSGLIVIILWTWPRQIGRTLQGIGHIGHLIMCLGKLKNWQGRLPR